MRILAILLIIPFFASAQPNPAFVIKNDLRYNKLEYKGEGLFGFELNDKFGYIDATGKTIIPADYSYSLNSSTIPFFYKGVVAVKKESKMGIIDKTGKIIIPFSYDYLAVSYQIKDAFVAANKVNEKLIYGIINTQNKEVIPLIYPEIFMDSNLVKVKKDVKWGLMNIAGKQILPFDYDAITIYSKERLVQATKGDQIIFFDADGKQLFEKAKNVYTISSCGEGMITCKVNDKYGYLDLKGNEVIITRYDEAAAFANGLAKVGKKSLTSGSKTLYGYIDKKGNEVIPVKYETLGSFNNGLAYLKDPETNRYGFVDKTGKWVLNPVYLDLTIFDNLGGAWVKQTDGKYHYINKSGKDFGTLDDAGSSYKNFFKEGYAVYENTVQSYGLIDKTGKVLKTIDDCDGIYTFSDGIAGYKCKSSGKYGFLDLNGNKIIPCEYDGFTGFTEGISKVDKKTDGKTRSGYIDNQGNILVPIVYENVYGFRNGWGLIKKDSNYFFVDRNGNLKDPPRKYDELTEFRSGFALGKLKGTGTNPGTYYYINTQLKEEFSITAKEAYLFWEDVAIIKRDKDYEMMNKKGEVFKSLTGIDFLKFSNDGMLAVREKGKWGFINDRGDVIIKPQYDSCDSFKFGFAKIKKGTLWGIIDKSGTEIITPRYENILPGENGMFIFYDKAWGVMDKTGRIIVQPTLFTITLYEKDRALAKLGKTYTILKSPLLK
jgi:hypothetical protein